MVAEPVISSMRVLCGAPRTLIEHSMRKHVPSSVEELDRICGEFVGAGPFSFGTNVLPGYQAQTPEQRPLSVHNRGNAFMLAKA